jgi:hypothetical protein
MRTEKRHVLLGRNAAMGWVLLAVMAMGSVQAAAQPRGRWGSGLEPDDAKAAWALQAEHAAGKLKLDEETTDKLVKAYQAARTSFQASLEAKMSALRETEDRSARREAYRAAFTEVRNSEQAKFEKELETFLTEEQSENIAELLGAFDPRSDQMVHTIAGFELGDKQADALDLVDAYIKKQSEIRESMTGEQSDFSAYRDKMMAAKGELDTALEPLLTADQLATWKEATTYRRGGRRPE